MRRSHVCLGCGIDICAVAAPLDPHYRLPIVQCPKCKRAAVRQPARVPWTKTARSLWWMALQISMATLVFLTAWSTTASFDMTDLRAGLRGDPLMTASVVALTITMVVIGAWMGRALRHVPLWKLLVGWAVVLGVLAVLTSFDQQRGRWPELSWPLLRQRAQIVSSVWLLTGSMAGLARAASSDANRAAMARRMRKRRRRIARMMGE